MSRKAALRLIPIAVAVVAVLAWVSTRPPASRPAATAPDTPEDRADEPPQVGTAAARDGDTARRIDYPAALPHDGLDTEPAQVSVTGHVHTGSDKRPVPWVDVIFVRGRNEWTATSEDGGGFSLLLPPGSYQVRAVGDRVVGVGLPKLTIADQPTTYDVAVVPRVVVRGEARHLDGSPASGAVVVAFARDKSVAALAAKGELGSAEVEADGSFELITVPGEITLRASDGESSGAADAGRLAPGQQIDNVELVLVDNGHVAGVVLDPRGAPVAEADVLISVEIPGTGEFDRVPHVTDDRGRFRWQLPRPGSIIVEASASGLAQSSPIAFTLNPGEDRTGLELVLREASYRLAGRVVDDKGAPVPLVEIAQGEEGSKARYKRTLTDADGAFELTGLSRGPHRLRARKRGYRLTRVRNIDAPRTDIEIVAPIATASAP